jgi:hypothetical protein
VSARNVRKVRNPEGIPALAAMILSAGGLLNPLAVVPEKRKGSRVETFGVVAGGAGWRRCNTCSRAARCRRTFRFRVGSFQSGVAWASA